MMQAVGIDGAWTGRPVLSNLVRAVQYGLPLLLGTGMARLVGSVLSGRVAPVWVLLLSVGVAVAVSLTASRATMRLAPLAVLLQMTMIFPDRAPSRLKVARRSTSAVEISRQLDSPDATAQEAAMTMLALVTALGKHDKHTRGHSERVRLFSDLLSQELGLSEADRGRLRWAALVHDIGKLQVSAAILNKPGKLEDTEWDAVRAHPAAGAMLAQPLAEWLGPWFAGIIQHHERYDGTGYPLGLAGRQITLAGRVVAVVDAFETMTAARSYKAAKSVVAARAELTRCAGTHFDPAIVRSFLAIALPRLLWAVGPLAFVLNVPFLKWVGDGGARLVDVAGSTAHGAVSAAGVTALVVASGASPTVTAAAVVPPSTAHHRGISATAPTALSVDLHPVGRTPSRVSSEGAGAGPARPVSPPSTSGPWRAPIASTEPTTPAARTSPSPSTKTKPSATQTPTTQPSTTQPTTPPAPPRVTKPKKTKKPDPPKEAKPTKTPEPKKTAVPKKTAAPKTPPPTKSASPKAPKHKKTSVK